MLTPEQIIELEAFDGWRRAISCDNLAATFSPELAGPQFSRRDAALAPQDHTIASRP
jgi:hypothetical protein